MLISIIIPCFNVESYIFDCVSTVMLQTYSTLEIICIDNNSTDNTWIKLEEIKNKFPEIEIVKELKPGANAARNKGLTIATGEWLQFLDADDLIDKRKLEHQVALVNNSSNEFAYIAAAFSRMDKDGNITGTKAIEPNKYTAIFKNRSGITSSNLWNRQKLLNVGGWDENLMSSQEVDLMFRLALYGMDYLADNVCLTIIRERPSGQISQSNPSERWRRYIDVRLRFLEKLKEKSFDTYKQNLSFYQDTLMVNILILSKYDLDTAENYYKTFIKGQWHSDYSLEFSFPKILLIKLIGFRMFSRLQS